MRKIKPMEIIKTLVLVFLILLSQNIYAQKSMFVRVYDLAGKKINKGYVLSVTDTSLLLKGNSAADTIYALAIGHIRTKHSAGNNLRIGSIVGASSMAILGVVTAEPDAEILGYSAGEGAAAGALIGAPIGAAIGGLTILFKNSKHYSIDGDLTKWKTFQKMIEGNSK